MVAAVNVEETASVGKTVGALEVYWETFGSSACDVVSRRKVVEVIQRMALESWCSRSS